MLENPSRRRVGPEWGTRDGSPGPSRSLPAPCSGILKTVGVPSACPYRWGPGGTSTFNRAHPGPTPSPIYGPPHAPHMPPSGTPPGSLPRPPRDPPGSLPGPSRAPPGHLQGLSRAPPGPLPGLSRVPHRDPPGPHRGGPSSGDPGPRPTRTANRGCYRDLHALSSRREQPAREQSNRPYQGVNCYMCTLKI